jgi:hypothetical protein
MPGRAIQARVSENGEGRGQASGPPEAGSGHGSPAIMRALSVSR